MFRPKVEVLEDRLVPSTLSPGLTLDQESGVLRLHQVQAVVRQEGPDLQVRYSLDDTLDHVARYAHEQVSRIEVTGDRPFENHTDRPATLNGGPLPPDPAAPDWDARAAQPETSTGTLSGEFLLATAERPTGPAGVLLLGGVLRVDRAAARLESRGDEVVLSYDLGAGEQSAAYARADVARVDVFGPSPWANEAGVLDRVFADYYRP